MVNCKVNTNCMRTDQRTLFLYREAIVQVRVSLWLQIVELCLIAQTERLQSRRHAHNTTLNFSIDLLPVSDSRLMIGGAY
jgi:hypothetical protein